MQSLVIAPHNWGFFAREMCVLATEMNVVEVLLFKAKAKSQSKLCTLFFLSLVNTTKENVTVPLFVLTIPH